MHPSISIPHPCHVGAEQLTPTAAGWHCAACQTPVIDFSRLSEADILAYLATPGRGSVCALVSTGPPPVPARSRRPRWLAVLLAVLGLRAAAAPAPPHDATTPPAGPAPTQARPAEAGQPSVLVRGQVLDDSLNVPVAGAWVFVAGTVYGAVADEQGRFELPIPLSRPEVRSGRVQLEVRAGYFSFVPQRLTVPLPPGAAPAALTVRLQSVPGRGHLKGKVKVQEPPRRF
ncbi:hypothetical protein EJV47_19190 [Hymenobacter gummosus]|uniref:Carboxypeptidase-like regulatory domain-containing protein n=1 Tax=Hymenobacter gummosus TaxID=1776032 RepID=A0A3S0H7G0_9BACT|nr:hypothetical protein [Hymenobacter gummosus]RTQ47543.1 hypothetical protein EJV47_19190 [Hymenobacter gummosus]